MSEKPYIPLDNEQRDIFRNDLSSSMIVEAGAGTGKTSLLIERMTTLVQSYNLNSVAGITFTEKAAAELKDRLRFALEKQLFESDPKRPKANLLKALAGLEQANLSTIHAFASGILRERAIEAGIDPNFGHIDDTEEFQLLCDAIKKRLESESGDLESWFNRFSVLGGEIEHFFTLGKQVYQERDLLPCFKYSERIFSLSSILREFTESVEELVSLCKEGCDKWTDLGAQQITNLAQSLKEVNPEQDQTVFRWLIEVTGLKKNSGAQSNWNDKLALKQFKEGTACLKDRTIEILQEARTGVLERMVEWLVDAVDDVQRIKRERGLISFQDQLNLARKLLEDSTVLRSLQNRFECLLIDEFQDTDPIQVQIALLLANKKPEYTGIRDAVPAPGKICVVGDPKQSIYRFRRADPDVYKAAAERIMSAGREINITQNFRSSTGIVDFANGFFEPIWETAVEGNCRYQKIKPLTDYPDIHPSPPILALLPKDAGVVGKMNTEEFRSSEAAAIADVIEDQVIAGEWQVAKREAGKPWKIRKVDYDDVVILMPTTTGIAIYTEALNARCIPYTIERGRGFFSREIVNQAYCCLAAIDNPLDRFSIVAAMRSTLFGVSDTGLVRWLEQSKGKMDYRNSHVDLPDEIAGPLDILNRLHQSRFAKSLPDLVEELFRRSCARQLLMTERNNWIEVDCLNRILELAVQFSLEHGDSLHRFTTWLGERIENQENDQGGSPSSVGQQGVRLMTIHSAKGLEFPVVILAGLGNESRSNNAVPIPDRLNNRLDLRTGSSSSGYFQSVGYEEAFTREKNALQAENMRLLYVAITRACNHLVIPLYGKVNKSSESSSYLKWLQDFLEKRELSASEREPLWRVFTHDPVQVRSLSSKPAEEFKIDADTIWKQVEQVRRDRKARLDDAVRRLPKRHSPSRHQTHPIEDFESSQTTEQIDYAVRIGRAFHFYMAECRPGEPIQHPLATHCARLEEVDSDGLKALLSNCLSCSIWKSASTARRMWREAPVFLQRSDGIMVGSIDLVLEDREGSLHIVDYKTGESELDRHLHQMRDYAEALKLSTGKRIASVSLYFASSDRIEVLEIG